MTSTETMISKSFTRLGSLRLSLGSRKDRLRREMVPASIKETPVIYEIKNSGKVSLPLTAAPEDDSVGSCIICVGSTGTGKSSTIAKYTGSKTKSGSGHDRVTKNCEIHRCIQDDDEPVWVDTVGWDDAECEDDETFKDILRFIDKYNITKVKAVIWNISPNVRRDALLTGQARLINMFQEKIWNNVIIVAKQSLNPDHDCQGALKAAEQYTKKPILFTGYRFYEDPTFSPKQREYFICEETRQTYNIKTDEEVRQILMDTLQLVPDPVQVVFKTKRCLVCSAKGDERLLSPFCHMQEQLVHAGAIENHHPGGQEKFHPSAHHVIEHDGRLKKSWYSSFCCGTLRKPRYTCCRRRSGKEGCKKKWACCKASWDNREDGCEYRYKCCGSLVSVSRTGCSPRYACCLQQVNSTGCKKVCKKCGADWGTQAGNCFRKEHKLVGILEKTEEEEKEEELRASLLNNLKQEADVQVVQEESAELDPFLSDRKDGNRKSKFGLPPVITYHMF